MIQAEHSIVNSFKNLRYGKLNKPSKSCGYNLTKSSMIDINTEKIP